MEDTCKTCYIFWKHETRNEFSFMKIYANEKTTSNLLSIYLKLNGGKIQIQEKPTSTHYIDWYFAVHPCNLIINKKIKPEIIDLIDEDTMKYMSCNWKKMTFAQEYIPIIANQIKSC